MPRLLLNFLEVERRRVCLYTSPELKGDGSSACIFPYRGVYSVQIMEKYSEPERIYAYQYKSVSHSLFDKVFRYWLNYAFRFIPPAMSANLLSMTGNLGSWFALILLVVLGDRVDLPHHRIVFALASFSVFFYHTVDNLDGRQAKRAGSCGPLGEFVDHWFDSFNVFFFPLGAIAAFPVIPLSWGIAIIILAGIADWLALREVMKTNVMYFGPVSTDEGIFVYWALLFFISILGYDFWAAPLPGIGIPPIGIVVFGVGLNFIYQIFRVLITYRFMGLREILVESLYYIPIILWIVATAPVLGERFALISGLLAIGFTGSRHVGDLLRVRLTGLALPRFYPDLAICLLFMLSVLFVNAIILPLPAWLLLFPMVVLFVDTAHALVLQFMRTARRVYECLGVTLFGTSPERAVTVEPVIQK